jgi:hypothetical protein
MAVVGGTPPSTNGERASILPNETLLPGVAGRVPSKLARLPPLTGHPQDFLPNSNVSPTTVHTDYQHSDMSDEFTSDFRELRTTTQSLVKQLTELDTQLMKWELPVAVDDQARNKHRTRTTVIRQPNLSRAEKLKQMRGEMNQFKQKVDNIYDLFLSRVAAFEEKSAPKEEAPKEEAPKEEAPKEEISKEEISKEEISKEEISKEEISKEESVSRLHNDQDKREFAAEEHNETRAEHQQRKDLRFRCEQKDLGDNLVATILKARATLGPGVVNARGYLILSTNSSLSDKDMVRLKNAATPYEDGYTRGFLVKRSGDYLTAHVDTATSIDLDEAQRNPCLNSTDSNSEQDFQAWIDEPTPQVRYLIGPPWGRNQFVNKFLSPGASLKRRPQIPGVNEPYWYLSLDANTPATMHIEDGNTGSANILLHGANKRWLVIHHASVEKFERCIKQEFPSPKKHCAQFVRHHNIILGPEWLKKRGIRFDIEDQRVGEVFCTLPGLVYHTVCNTGPNFAVAENYEFPDTPEQPTKYVWCRKGKGGDKCGEHVLTLRSFLYRPEEKETKSKSLANRDVIEILDDQDPCSAAQTFSKLHLPDPVSNVHQDTTNLIKACFNQTLTYEWFGCSKPEDLKAKLEHFLPGGWLNDDLLRALLLLIALPFNFYVCESLGVDIACPDMEWVRKALESAGLDSRGIVIPFNVSIGQQQFRTRSEQRNHWAIGLFDQHTSKFITYDIEGVVAQNWARVIEEAIASLSDTRVTVTVVPNQV